MDQKNHKNYFRPTVHWRIIDVKMKVFHAILATLLAFYVFFHTNVRLWSWPWRPKPLFMSQDIVLGCPRLILSKKKFANFDLRVTFLTLTLKISRSNYIFLRSHRLGLQFGIKKMSTFKTLIFSNFKFKFWSLNFNPRLKINAPLPIGIEMSFPMPLVSCLYLY